MQKIIGVMKVLTRIKNIKAILFDLDGTVVNTNDLILSSSRHCTQVVLGKTFSDEFYKAEVGKPLDDVIASFSNDVNLQKEMIRVYREHNVSCNDEMVKEFPDMRRVIDSFYNAGFKEGVITSKITSLAKHTLSLFGYDKYFEFVIGANDCKEHKPAPGPVRMGIEKLGLDPSECVYVGDSPYDIQAGKAAGCISVGVLWGMFSKEKLLEQNPDFICSNPTEIKELFL